MKSIATLSILAIIFCGGCATPRPEYSHPSGKSSALFRLQTTTVKGWGIHKGTVYFGFETNPSTIATPSATSTVGYYNIRGDDFGQDYVVPVGENLLFTLDLSKAGITKFYTCSAPFKFSPVQGKQYLIQVELDNEDDNYSCEAQLFERAGGTNMLIGTVKEYATAQGRMGAYRVDNSPPKVPQF
jgi:hypothetical protein